MTLPSSGAISLNQTNTELGRSATGSLGLNDSGVRGLTGQSSGAVDMNSLHGKSALSASSYSPTPGSYSVARDGDYTITCNQTVVWNTTTSGNVGSYTPASGSAATSWQYSTRVAAVAGTGTVTVTSNGYTWTLSVANSGSGTQCVAISSYLPNGKRAGDAAIGDEMWLLNRDNDDGYHVEPIRAVSFATRSCLRIVTASGISLVASIETPITTRNGVVVPITESLGVDVPVIDQGNFRWEPIVCLEDAGEQIVAKINVNDGTYAASESDDGRYVLSHNIKS